MKGDVIIVEDHHRRAAAEMLPYLTDQLKGLDRRLTVSVAGESGSGKSETATAIKEALDEQGIPAAILQQDDYFVLPPKSNDAKRRQDISWVGVQEVRLDLLDQHLEEARRGADQVHKPLVVYDDDTIESEQMSFRGVQVVIAEGTYTTLLNSVDVRVFIARNRLETMESRRKRAREAIEPFLERVLEIEHEIIAPQKENATIVVTRDYEVILPEQR